MQWNSKRAIVALLQIVVGTVFVFSGLVKSIDPVGTAIKLQEYFSLIHFELSIFSSLVLSILLNTFEGTLGILLLMGFQPRLTRWVALLLMSVMTLLTLYIYLFNPVADCGCFGDAFVISNKATFLKNVVLILIVVYLYLHSKEWYQWLPLQLSNYAVLTWIVLLINFNSTNVIHLPIIDFRPYKVGSDLMELTTTGGSDGEYIYNFVYQKDGKEKLFGIDELSSLDSTWTFVRDQIEVVKEAERPAGADFVLLREDGSNAMEDLMNPDARSILVISPDLTEASTKQLKEMAQRTKHPLLLAIGNTGDIWDNQKYTSLESNFSEVYFLDSKTAKTIVRSNPGVLLISDGKINKKLSGRDYVRALNDEAFRDNPFITDRKKQQIDTFVDYGLILLLGAIYMVYFIIKGMVIRFNNKK